MYAQSAHTNYIQIHTQEIKTTHKVRLPSSNGHVERFDGMLFFGISVKNAARRTERLFAKCPKRKIWENSAPPEIQHMGHTGLTFSPVNPSEKMESPDFDNSDKHQNRPNGRQRRRIKIPSPDAKFTKAMFRLTKGM